MKKSITRDYLYEIVSKCVYRILEESRFKYLDAQTELDDISRGKQMAFDTKNHEKEVELSQKYDELNYGDEYYYGGPLYALREYMKEYNIDYETALRLEAGARNNKDYDTVITEITPCFRKRICDLYPDLVNDNNFIDEYEAIRGKFNHTYHRIINDDGTDDWVKK